MKILITMRNLARFIAGVTVSPPAFLAAVLLHVATLLLRLAASQTEWLLDKAQQVVVTAMDWMND